jgi:hypothetical protein
MLPGLASQLMTHLLSALRKTKKTDSQVALLLALSTAFVSASQDPVLHNEIAKFLEDSKLLNFVLQSDLESAGAEVKEATQKLLSKIAHAFPDYLTAAWKNGTLEHKLSCSHVSDWISKYRR